MSSEESHGIKAKASYQKISENNNFRGHLIQPSCKQVETRKGEEKISQGPALLLWEIGPEPSLPTPRIYNPWEARAGKNLGRGAVGYVERNLGRNHRSLTALVLSTTSNLEVNQHLTTKNMKMDMDVLNSKLISELKNMDSDE